MRNWAAVTGDWLHVYVYRPTLISTKNQTLSVFMAFIFSGLFHDYWFTVAFQFFCPCQTIVLLLTAYTVVRNKHTSRTHTHIDVYSPKRAFAAIVTFTFFLSTGAYEYYFRQNTAPVYENYIIDAVIPRTFEKLY